MTKRFLIAVIVALTAFASIMTYVAYGQGVLLDRMLRCAQISSRMEA